MKNRSYHLYNNFTLLCLAAFMLFSFTLKHPFYLGITDLKYNIKQKSLEGTVKLFTNDIEEAISKLYHLKADLINGKDKEAMNKILQDYVRNHLKMKVNLKAVEITVLGFEHEAEAIWLYVEINNCPLPKKMEIENTLLYDYIKSQINIVHCQVKEMTQSSKLTNPDKKMVLEF